MIVKVLTEHHLEFLTLKGGCRGSAEYTLVKMPHCWKPHAMAQLLVLIARTSSEGAKAQSRQSPHCLQVHAENYASSPTN